MTAIERLRALEKETRRKANVNLSMSSDERWPEGVRHCHKVSSTVLFEHADELSTLIAELGQEVGSDWQFALERGE